MELFGAIGGGLFVLASLVVGGRIALRVRSLEQVPEIALGGGLFLMGGLGYPMMTAAVQATGLSDGVRIGLAGAHVVINVVGMSAVGWFTQRVFRRDATWARTLLGLIVAGFLGLAAVQVFGPGLLAYVNDPDHGPWRQQIYLGLAVMVWSGTEPLLYWRVQRRRLAIGLADPVVCDRLRLWGGSILCAATISAVSIVLTWMGIPIATAAVGNLLVGTLGVVTAALLYLAFMPPERYVAWVRARSASASA